MNISFEKLAPPVAFVLVGFAMAIIGASGVVPFLNPPVTLDSPTSQVLFVFLGIALIIIGPIIYVRQITSLPKTAQIKRGLSREDFGIEVLKPGDDEKVGNSFEVVGTYKDLPKGYSIWICTYVGEGEKRQIWPQDEPAEVDYDGKKGIWRGRMGWLGGDKGEPQKFLVYVTGEDGDALFSYFKKAGNENTNKVKRETGSDVVLWPSIEKTTSDTTLCKVVRVRK